MEKKHLRPALAAFLLMMTMSLLSTALSFFVTPVCEDLGFGRGSFTLYYSLMVAAGAVSASFLGNYMNSHGVRGVVLLSGIWCGVGFFGLSFSSSLWMFYLVGAAMGLLGSTCVYLAANVIVQQSYSPRDASAMLGLVMAGAGIGGVVWSNVVPGVIASMGWRFAYRALGVCWVVLALLAAVILGKKDLTGGIGHAKNAAGGNDSKKQALKSVRFVLVVTLMCVLTVASCISQQLPAVLGGLGHAGDQVSVMISVMTAASAVGTVVEGVVCSKIGIQKTMVIVLLMYAGGYVMLSGGMAYPALVCLAFGSGSIGTLMPIVVRQIFGGRDYAAIWSVVISCSSVASFLATPVWGMVYDFFGTYAPALTVMPIALVAAIFAMMGAFGKKRATV